MRGWLWSVAALALFLLASYAAVRWLLPAVLPFVLGAVLAELVNPLVDWLSAERGRVRLPRGLAAGLVVGAAAALLVLVATLAVARLVREMYDLLQALPYYYAMGVDLAGRWSAALGAFSGTLPRAVQDLVQELLGQAQALLKTALPTAAAALQAFASLPALLTDVLVTFLVAFFLSRDRRAVGRFLLGLLPAGIRAQVREVKDRVWAAAMGWAKAQVLLVTLTATFSTAGLLALGADYAVLAGLLVGVADILPLVGPALIYIPWVAFQFLTGHTAMGLKILALYAVVAGIRQFLEPKLVAEQTGLHPLATLAALYLGFKAFGAVGFVLGPLLAILLKALVQSNLLPIFQDPGE